MVLTLSLEVSYLLLEEALLDARYDLDSSLLNLSTLWLGLLTAYNFIYLLVDPCLGCKFALGEVEDKNDVISFPCPFCFPPWFSSFKYLANIS